MKLILYKHNLTNTWLPNCCVDLTCFPEHIQASARFAKVVEYQDGEYKRTLKDRNNSIPMTDTEFATFVINNANKHGFNVSFGVSRPGNIIRNIELKR